MGRAPKTPATQDNVTSSIMSVLQAGRRVEGQSTKDKQPLSLDLFIKKAIAFLKPHPTTATQLPKLGYMTTCCSCKKAWRDEYVYF